MSLENICALSTVLLPFVMLLKNSVIKGYIYFISFLGGLMAVIIIPNNMNGMKIYEFELLRYWTCHFVLFLVPVVACLTKEYKPNYKYSLFISFRTNNNFTKRNIPIKNWLSRLWNRAFLKSKSP